MAEQESRMLNYCAVPSCPEYPYLFSVLSIVYITMNIHSTNGIFLPGPRRILQIACPARVSRLASCPTRGSVADWLAGNSSPSADGAISNPVQRAEEYCAVVSIVPVMLEGLL